MDNFFQILGLRLEADDAQIAEAIKKKRQDLKSDPAALKRAEEAYSVLANPFKRKTYRQELSRSGSSPGASDNKTGNEPELNRTNESQGPNRGAAGDQTTPEDHGRRSDQRQAGASSGSKRNDTEFFDPLEESGAATGSSAARENHGSESHTTRHETELMDDPPIQMHENEARTDQRAGGDAPDDENSDETRVRQSNATGGRQPSRGSIKVSYEGQSAVFNLKPGENVIGRPPREGSQPDIQLPDRQRLISRRHAIIRILGKIITIEDMGSVNGTRLNGKLLDKQRQHVLKDGDVIVIEGRALTVQLL